MDDARRGDRRGRIDDAADDAAGSIFCVEQAGRIEALQLSGRRSLPPSFWKYHQGRPFCTVSTIGVGAEQMVDVAHHLVEEVRLDGEHDEILLAGLRRACRPP